jgi:hypothetical protein
LARRVNRRPKVLSAAEDNAFLEVGDDGGVQAGRRTDDGPQTADNTYVCSEWARSAYDE